MEKLLEKECLSIRYVLQESVNCSSLLLSMHVWILSCTCIHPSLYKEKMYGKIMLTENCCKRTKGSGVVELPEQTGQIKFSGTQGMYMCVQDKLKVYLLYVY